MKVTLRYKSGAVSTGFEFNPFRRDDNHDGTFTWFLDDRRLTGFPTGEKEFVVLSEELDEEVECPF